MSGAQEVLRRTSTAARALRVLLAVLIGCVCAPAAGAQYSLTITSVTPNASSTTAAVRVEYAGAYGQDLYCDPNEGMCYYVPWDESVYTTGGFAFAVNGSDYTSAMAISGPTTSCEYYDPAYPGWYKCVLEYVATGTVPINPLYVNGLTATAYGTNPGSLSDTFTLDTRPQFAIEVTPDSLKVVGPYAGQNTQTFYVRNVGLQAATFALSVQCSGTIINSGSCVLSPSSVHLAVGALASMSVTYDVASSTGTSGQIQVTASGNGVQDVGTVLLSRPAIALAPTTPGTTVEKDQCMVFSIIPDVANECGVLRITHPLPAVRTLGKARVPTLVYYEDQNSTAPVIAVRVNLSASARVPTSVRITVVERRADGVVQLAQETHDGAYWAADREQQVATWLWLGASSGPSRIVPYRVSVDFLYDGVWQPAAPPIDGELAVVDRRSSSFGEGWWLAGLEQLVIGQPQPDPATPGSRMLWVGGDGSTRAYAKVNDTVWVAPTVDHPDTIKVRNGNTEYVRLLPHGLKVRFDATGRHVATENRLGQVTRFVYQSANPTLLDSIVLPPAGAGMAYTFHYEGGILRSVGAPGASGMRVTYLNHDPNDPNAVREIVDSDGSRVSFEPYWWATGTVHARTDRRGTRTEFGVDSYTRSMSYAETLDGGQVVRTSFRDGRTAGGAEPGQPPVPVADAYTLHDGPRIDVTDVTKFWTNSLGAPIKIVNALNQATTIEYGDPRQPALATRVVRPNGFTTLARYDERGNLAQSVAENPLEDDRDATTTYAWDAAFDFVTRIQSPEGVVTTFAYDSLTGNRLWQQTGGELRRVTFNYGNEFKLLSSAVAPGTARDSVRYDALGNVEATMTPKGYWTRYARDGIGRERLVVSPIDSADKTFGGDDDGRSQVSVVYDAAGRDSVSESSAPAPSGPGRQTVTVRKLYDAEGNLTSLMRKSTPDAAGLDSVTTRWRYDAVGRKVAEVAPGLRADGTEMVDSTVYDPAGNATELVTRLTRSKGVAGITMTYDALNRLSTRVVPSVHYDSLRRGLANVRFETPGSPTGNTLFYPTYPNDSAEANTGYRIAGETSVFTYDPVSGSMTSANNDDAKVSRTYYRGGLLKTETQKIRALESADTTLHTYTTKYFYGRDGRRVAIEYPTQLRPTPTNITANYTYDAQTGELAEVKDLLSNTFIYSYNNRGDLSELWRTGMVVDSTAYDDDGNLTYHRLKRYGAESNWLLREVRFQHDARGKVLTSTDASGFNENLHAAYSGLGRAVSSVDTSRTLTAGGTTATYGTTESMQSDALGNVTQQTTTTTYSVGNQFSQSPRYLFYERFTGRLQRDSSAERTTKYTYDDAGNTLFNTNVVAPDGTWQDRAAYYAADGRLRAAETRTANNSGAPDFKLVFDEYRYDALGRRVLVRTRRECQEQVDSRAYGECQMSFIRRTIWDGDQELGEIQMPGDTVYRSWFENDTVMVRRSPVQKTYCPSPTSSDCTVLSFGDYNPFYGRVAYTYGLALDQPLSVTRLGFADQPEGRTYRSDMGSFAIMPEWNFRGVTDHVTFRDGGLYKCYANETDRCAQVVFPAAWFVYNRPRFRPEGWFGTLVEDKQDHSGTLYRRNRYYDPQSGRFTQEDPIGLAGGLNVYGFANGDPVNFGDPFGLCPLCEVAGVGFMVAMGSKAMDPVNERRIAQLDASVQTSARLFVNLSAAAGAPIRITQGLRTFEEQDELYAQGRTAPGEIVTNARGGQSYHNYGLAIDVAPVENGQANPNKYPTTQSVTVGKSLGWEWGGDWKRFQDQPHFQKTGGRSIRELQQEQR